jgi:hypothetical protein
MSLLKHELLNLKYELLSDDVLLDQYDNLYKIYENFIDTITNDNKYEKLEKLHKMIYKDNLHCDGELHEVFRIFNRIKKVKK